MKPFTIKSWNDKEYTLQDILEACDEADRAEIDLSDVFDGDLATVPTLVRGLINRIQELEAKNVK
jgi:hypothetical protein